MIVMKAFLEPATMRPKSMITNKLRSMKVACRIVLPNSPGLACHVPLLVKHENMSHTMKASAAFTATSFSGLARAGHWGALPTPAILLSTSLGQPSHLLRDTLALLPRETTAAMTIRLGQIWDLQQAISETALDADRSTVMLLRDPGIKHGTLQASDAGVTFETLAGRRKVTPAEYVEVVKRSHPLVAVSFHDECGLSVGSKRSRATVSRSLQWLEQGLRAAATSRRDAADGRSTSILAYVPLVTDDAQRQAAVAGVIAAVSAASSLSSLPSGAGGPAPVDTAAAIAPAAAAASHPHPSAANDAPPLVCGFVLGGVGLDESASLRSRVLAASLPALPPGGVRVISGLARPIDILRAVAQGIDVFDSDLASALTAHRCAAAFAYVLGSAPTLADRAGAAATQPSVKSGPGVLSTAIPVWADAESDPPAARAPGPQAAAKPAWLDLDSTALDVLAQPSFASDARPLVPGCSCFACAGVPPPAAAAAHVPPAGRAAGNEPHAAARPVTCGGHRRAYIHHLLQTREMLGSVLLHAHNVYHVGEWIRHVRAAVVEGRLDAYITWFCAANGVDEDAQSAAGTGHSTGSAAAVPACGAADAAGTEGAAD
jgi:queuine tRNA-ribosyltransferase accessory subunit